MRLDEGQVALAEAFTAHVSAVQQQVSLYADALSGDDEALRKHLSDVEAGVPWRQSW